MLTAFLHLPGILTAVIGIALAPQFGPSHHVPLAVGSSIAMLIAWLTLLIFQAGLKDFIGVEYGPPIIWILACLVQPIMTGLGACVIAHRAKP